MRTHVSMLLALALSAQAIAEKCPPAPGHERRTSITSKPLAPARFDEITKDMKIWQIIQRHFASG